MTSVLSQVIIEQRHVPGRAAAHADSATVGQGRSGGAGLGAALVAATVVAGATLTRPGASAAQCRRRVAESAPTEQNQHGPPSPRTDADPWRTQTVGAM